MVPNTMAVTRNACCPRAAWPQLRYTCLRMASEILIDAVNSLSPDEQASVLRFIDHLKQQNASGKSAFLQAADQFIAEHPELLHRLSQ